MPRQPCTVITSPRKQGWAEDGSRLDLAPRMVCLQPARVTRPLPAAGRNPIRPIDQSVRNLLTILGTNLLTILGTNLLPIAPIPPRGRSRRGGFPRRAGELEAEKENAKVEEVDDRAPITGGGRKQSPSRDRRSCHQCKRVKPRPEEMIRCQCCDLRIYCAACVRNRQCIPSISPCSVLSIILFFFLLFLRSRKGNCRCYRATLRFCRYPALSEAEEREACPFCRGVCICTLCDKQAKSKVRILYPSMELR
jgi:hypothetical protein